MIDLKQFKNNSIQKGLCQGYTDMWSDEKSKCQLFELACDTNAVEYMAKSLSQGWGLSPEYIADKFNFFINGRYICKYKNEKGHGYTSTMLCKYNGEKFLIDTTLLCVLETNTKLVVSPYHICKIYVAGESNLSIELGENSRCYIYLYGKEPVLTGDYMNNRVIVKRIIEEVDE